MFFSADVQVEPQALTSAYEWVNDDDVNVLYMVGRLEKALYKHRFI